MQLQSVPGDPSDDAADRLAMRGVLLVAGAVDDAKASLVAARAMAAALDDPGRGLTVHLTNVTGSAAAAIALHDLLHRVDTKVTIVAGGMLETAGAIILQAGSPGGRHVLPSTRLFLRRIEEPRHVDDVESAAAELEGIRAHASEILGRPLDRPWMLTAEEAVAAGLADRVSLHRE